jgi:ADP-ribose pyrophosphatase YjhB (NUDIX family)
MPAKPIIDIAIAVEDFDRATVCIRPIAALGYEYRGENGIPRRHYFVKRDPRSTHHVHMVEKTSWDWEKMLLFRDRLAQEPALAQEYADTKTRLARRFERERGAYQRGKVPFIERVVGPRPETEARFDSLTSLPLTRRWRNQAYPVASVLAIVRRDITAEDEAVPHYLLIQRQKEPYAGKWGLVGGRWEFGETLETAITREVKEETGLDTTFVALRGVVSERIAPGNADVEGAHYVLFVCELSAASGLAREQSEGPVAWFTPHDIVELQDRQAIIVTDHAILKRFAQIDAPLTYLEVDVVAGEGADEADQLVRFAAGP